MNFMKMNFKNKLLSTTAVAASLFIAGCGQQQNPNTLNQGVGANGGMPVFGAGGQMMTGQIPFTASGADLNNIHLIAGNTPTYGQKGTVSLAGGSGAVNNPYGINFSKNSMNGSIQYSVTQPTSGTQLTGTITGFISLSQAAMGLIQSQGMYSGFPNQFTNPGYNPNMMPQIQGIGIHSVHTVQLNQPNYYNPYSGGMPYATTGFINSAQIFVYLANSSAPYIPVLMQ